MLSIIVKYIRCAFTHIFSGNGLLISSIIVAITIPIYQNETQIKLDLFEKRLVVYNALKDIMKLQYHLKLADNTNSAFNKQSMHAELKAMIIVVTNRNAKLIQTVHILDDRYKEEKTTEFSMIFDEAHLITQEFDSYPFLFGNNQENNKLFDVISYQMGLYIVLLQKHFLNHVSEINCKEHKIDTNEIDRKEVILSDDMVDAVEHLYQYVSQETAIDNLF